MKTQSQLKARKSFDYQCRLASNCRHDKYHASCYGCPELNQCSIQAAIEQARKKMNLTNT